METEKTVEKNFPPSPPAVKRAKTGAKMHFIDPHATKKRKKMPPFSSWRRRNNACLHFSVVHRLRKAREI